MKRINSRDQTERVTVLVLSGGGSNGAWGAGFLNGWNQSGDRPKFDIVTGVSTGALMATGAFLGDDDLLAKAYTTISNADVKGEKFLLSIPFSDSVYSSAPLQHLIKTHITNAIIQSVADHSKNGRRLYVATTNLDAGELRVWNLSAIAQAGEYDLYRKVILASASVPLLFPPVDIDGTFYADGGVRANLFIRTYILPHVSTAHVSAVKTLRMNAIPSSMPASEPTQTVYVIMNGPLGIGTTCVGDCLIPIALRSLSALMDANNIANLYATKYLSSEFKYDFRLSYIPNEITPLDAFDFDKAGMNRLYNQAIGVAKSGDRWRDIPDVEQHPDAERHF